MTATLQAILDLISQHPTWAAVLVFVSALAEAIAIVGTIYPGSAILVAAGAAVGFGHLPLWPILIASILGAVAGDGVSYWVGHHYKERVHTVWPFKQRPQLLAAGEAFFVRHGAKSVLLARFTPVLRAIVPLVAGSVGMPPARFYLANFASALLWAPAHVLPGAILGLSLGALGVLSTRLMAVIIVVGVFVVLAVWLLRIALLRLVPAVEMLQSRVAAQAARRSDSRVARAVVAVLDPDRPGSRTLLLLGTFLLACVIGFISVAENVIAGDAIIRMNASVSTFVQGLRTTWVDGVMIVVTTLGDGVVTAVVAVATIAWLAWRRAWRLAIGLAAVILLAAVSVPLMKSAVALPRPISLYSGAESYSFPSGHATFSATLYGSLAWLVGSSLTAGRRAVVFTIAGTFIALIAASRVYLAAHWPSDVAAGLMFGFALASLYGLVFWRIDLSQVRPRRLGAVAAITLLVFGSWHAWKIHDRAETMYAQATPKIVRMSDADWRMNGWQSLPATRIDLEGETEEPFVLQWAGRPALLAHALSAQGWQSAPPVTVASLLGFLSATTPANTLPVLPKLESGRSPVLTLVRKADDPDQRIVLRLWSSKFAVTVPHGKPTRIYLGSLVDERIRRWWGLVTTVDDRAVPDAFVDALQSILAASPAISLDVKRSGPQTHLLAASIGTQHDKAASAARRGTAPDLTMGRTLGRTIGHR